MKYPPAVRRNSAKKSRQIDQRKNRGDVLWSEDFEFEFHRGEP